MRLCPALQDLEDVLATDTCESVRTLYYKIDLMLMPCYAESYALRHFVCNGPFSRCWVQLRCLSIQVLCSPPP